MSLCRSDWILQKGYCFLPHQGCYRAPEPRRFLTCLQCTLAHLQTGWSAARLVSRQRQTDETLWFLQQFIYTPLSTTPNLLTTLNMVAACLGCWRVLLFCSIYLIFTDVSWKGLCQNAEYAMLLVNVPMIKNWFLKSDAHRNYLFLFVICRVMCSDHSSAASQFHMIIISIPRKQVLMEGHQRQPVMELKS